MYFYAKIMEGSWESRFVYGADSFVHPKGQSAQVVGYVGMYRYVSRLVRSST